MEVAGALRSARSAAGLSQRSLARRAGVSSGAVSRYESGAALPSLPTLDRLLATCGKDVRLVVVDRVHSLDAELARLAALPRNRRSPDEHWMRGSFLERMASYDTQVLVAGCWAADLHALPNEGGEGRLLLPGDRIEHLVRALCASALPLRRLEGHYASLPVRVSTFTEPVAHWRLREVGSFRTEVSPEDGSWPVEQRLSTPRGPLRVAAAETLGEQDGVRPEVAEGWRALRAAAGPDLAPWSAARGSGAT